MIQKRKAPPGGKGGLAAAARTLWIIEYLADAESGLSVSELSRRLDVNKSIAFRIVSTLEALGYVYQDQMTQHYHLTYKISNLGLRQLSTSRLIDQCSPILRALAERTGEHVRLALIEENRPIWVHAASGPQRRLVIDPVYTSHEVSNHAHATGKAWLMTLSDDELDRLLGNKPLEKYTKYTIFSLSKLKADLRKWRKCGFAISVEESDLGVGTVAAPIVIEDATGNLICVGVVSLAAPTSRMNGDALIASGSLVIETARRLGETWPLEFDHLHRPISATDKRPPDKRPKMPIDSIARHGSQ